MRKIRKAAKQNVITLSSLSESDRDASSVVLHLPVAADEGVCN